MSDFAIFGVRHHGPGCARSLRRALEDMKPDCVLIEGPPEADALLSFAAAGDMVPPVAILLYAPDDPKRASFYPFAEFSPEWQAILYAAGANTPVRFMDLPQTHQLALEREGPEDEEEETSDKIDSADEAGLRRDPLGWLGEAAGYGGGEEWWERMVEQRQDGTELFEAIAEAMAAVRENTPPPGDPLEARREALREAHMRKVMRVVRKEGFTRIAVVCGAWHVPALGEMPPATSDNDLLKNLPRIKVEATWIPWTYERLAAESGYGAGVDSPAWYEHLWRREGNAATTTWFTRVARLLREAGIDCSSAHVIECVRLSDALAAVRERPLPGLNEMMESARTILTTGEDAPLRLIRRDLIVGRRLGRVADGVPVVPLQRDLEKLQKSLRLKPSAFQESLDLDLRREVDLRRSHLLHRLRLLRIKWGAVTASRAGKGTFHEIWMLEWKPEFALSVIEASPYGNTVESAAAAFSIESARNSISLPVLTELVTSLLLADLPPALSKVMHELENRAALTGDIPQLIEAVPPLAKVSRYGDVRQTDSAQVRNVLSGLIVRICIGLAGACQAIDDEAADELAEKIRSFQESLELLANDEHLTMWLAALTPLADKDGIAPRLRGLFARILVDARREPPNQASARMRQALSRSVAPEVASVWLEGFLTGSGMLLVHDEALLELLCEWIASLREEHFMEVLPLVRRTFATFPPMERRQIGERVQIRGRTGASSPKTESVDCEWDEARTAAVLPVFKTILGLEGSIR